MKDKGCNHMNDDIDDEMGDDLDEEIDNDVDFLDLEFLKGIMDKPSRYDGFWQNAKKFESEPETTVVLGIGSYGCQLLRYLWNTNKYSDESHFITIAIHSDAEFLAQSRADYTLLLSNDQLNWDEHQQLTDESNAYLCERIGELFRKVDIFFIFVDGSEIQATHQASCVLNLLKQKTISHQFFNVAIINEPECSENPALNQQFAEGRKQLLQLCDTVIVNSTQRIMRSLQQARQSINDYRLQEFQASCQAIRAFTGYLLQPSAVCGGGLANVYAVVSGMGEAIAAVGQRRGADRATLAAKDALLQLQQEWRDLKHPDVGAILVAICANKWHDPKVFKDVSNQIAQYTGGEKLFIKINKSLDETMPAGVIEVSILAVKNKMSDTLSKSN
jgi:cell division GTPase FtsZ